MSSWQPIGSAPKEESVLLFYPLDAGNSTSGVIQGEWLGFEEVWETIIGTIGEPTHWMPLPEPPTAAHQP